jgi:hypothetical protein
MLSLADRLTVPQVFVNSQHIGGAEEMMELLHKWDSENKNVADYYQQEIASQPDPTDPRLQIPTSPPVVEAPTPPRDHADSVTLPDGTKTTVLETMETLKSILPCQELKYNLTAYKKAVKGSDVVKALVESTNYSSIQTPEQAVSFAKTLRQVMILRHVLDETKEFENTNKLYYRLQCYQQPNILNSYRIWTERVDNNVMGLLKRLKKLLSKVELAATNAEGYVDYKNAHQNEHYPIFEEAICELQGVYMGVMDEPIRLAFGINVYNLMIKYAFMKVGIGPSNLVRASFFSGVKMNIGGDIMSFDDLENGVLRSNRKHPFSFSVPFGSKDPRARLSLREADCRIHFALNCGAKSCPPVKDFTAEAIDEELRIAAMAFCEQDENVRVDSEGNALYLSMIFNWYRVDFAPSNSELPHKVVTFLRGNKKKALQNMIDSGKSIAVKFLDYDWGTNASDYVPFNSSALRADEKSPLRVLF